MGTSETSTLKLENYEELQKIPGSVFMQREQKGMPAKLLMDVKKLMEELGKEHPEAGGRTTMDNLKAKRDVYKIMYKKQYERFKDKI